MKNKLTRYLLQSDIAMAREGYEIHVLLDKTLAEYLKYNKVVKHVEYVKKEEAGYIIINEDGYVLALYVYPKFRGLGIATRLLKHVINKYGYVYLNTMSEKVAHIAKKLGMKFQHGFVSKTTGKVEAVYTTAKLVLRNNLIK